MHTDIVPSEQVSLLEKGLQPAPFIHDPLAEVSGNRRRPVEPPLKDGMPRRTARRGTPDSLDDILGPDGMSDEDDFVVDDEDGAGYDGAINGFGKRTNGHLDLEGMPDLKRRAAQSSWQPRIHESFQPGSTPWRGNRRYLCLNLIGFVWTVDQDTHHTVTVEFYDREFHRDFHFTDPFLYDKACLSEKGTLFACQTSHSGDQPAMVYYRPHESWTTRAEWRTSLPKGENVTAIALSDSFVVVTTSTNYVRVFTLFGTPVRVYRRKSSPIVTCASWRDYVLTIGNGPVGGDGVTRLLYTIENVKRDDVCQMEDVVALAEGSQIQNVFFSDTGVGGSAAMGFKNFSLNGAVGPMHLRLRRRPACPYALADPWASSMGALARHEATRSSGRRPKTRNLLACSCGPREVLLHHPEGWRSTSILSPSAA